MTLFRSEVYERKTKHWLGTIQLARPVSFSIVCVMAVLIFLLTLILLIEGTYTRKARLTGILAPIDGAATLSASGAGVIQDVRFHEGDIVKKGDVLFIIDTDRRSIVDKNSGSDIAFAAAQIASRLQSAESDRINRIAIADQRNRATSDQIKSGVDEISEIDEEIVLQTRRVALVEKMLVRYQKLKDDGYFSDAQLQSKQDEDFDMVAKLRSLQRNRLDLIKNQDVLKAAKKSAKMELLSELSLADRNLSSLRQERVEMLSKSTSVITAPHNGRLAGLGVQIGQSVRDGQSLGTVIPMQNGTTALQAQLYAPSKTIGFVQEGQRVYLRYAAFPYQKFGIHQGIVKRISTTPFAINELPTNLSQQVATQVGNNEALYRIDVALEKQNLTAFGKEITLRPGLALEADVRQDTRKLWELLFEPLMGVKAQVDAR